MNEEVFSDFIQNIDAIDSHTCIYPKVKYSEADIIRLPFKIQFITIQNGIVTINYENGVYAEIIRR